MAEIVRMPRLSDTMTDGVVSKWHKKEGDQIKEGDLLADIETDKATMEFESFQEGVLLYIGVKESESAPVDSILAILGEENEDISSLINQENSILSNNSESQEVIVKEEKVEITSKVDKNEKLVEIQDEKRLKISPLARKIANERGIDINLISGSGENGRIIKRDLDTPSFINDNNINESSSISSGETQPLSQMRKTIANRLSQSKFTAPHFYLTTKINVDGLFELRKSLMNNLDTKISFNDIIIKAVSLSLSKHPNINVSWGGFNNSKY